MKQLTDSRIPILAGFSHRMAAFSEPVVCHPEHEINVALSGESVYHLDGEDDLPLSAGEILVLPGGTRHAIDVARSFHMAVIHVHPAVLESLDGLPRPLRTIAAALRAGTGPRYRKVMLPELNQRLEWLTEDVVLEQRRREPGRETMLRILAHQAATYLLRLLHAEPCDLGPDEGARRVHIARAWIDRHFAEPCSIEWLAGMAHLAPTYFAARFRALVGVPPMTYVRDLRLRQARHLLEQTDEPAKVVAWNVGYSDVGNFYRAFKQATGVTPIQYRARSSARRR